MARIIGNIKPDWTVVRYETQEDLEKLRDYRIDQIATFLETGTFHHLCNGLITFDEENYDIGGSINYFTVSISTTRGTGVQKFRLKISPEVLDLPGLENVIEKINRQFINDKWHMFPTYRDMVQQVAKDYNEWMQYAREKKEFDLDETWSPTDAGYTLVFPIWRDVERIINQ